MLDAYREHVAERAQKTFPPHHYHLHKSRRSLNCSPTRRLAKKRFWLSC